ncbi:MAG: flavin reductase [Pseudomonadota bacterium]
MSEASTTGDPADTMALRQVLGRFATGVTIVTCRDKSGVPVGMTANSFASVSLDPPLVLWSVDRSALSFSAFAEAPAFAFSILGQDQVELSNRFAKQGAEKFDVTAWHDNQEGVPLIDDPAAHIECVAHSSFDGGDHLVIVGRVVRFRRFERAGLVFAQGRYGAVAPHPGPMTAADDGDAAARHPYDDFLVPLLFRAYNHMFDGLSGALVAEDSTGAEMRILAILQAEGPAAEERILTRSMLSQTRFDDARRSLCDAGLISSDGHSCGLTEAGRTRLAELLRRAAERERQSTAALDRTDVELLKDLLRRLVKHHEAMA